MTPPALRATSPASPGGNVTGSLSGFAGSSSPAAIFSSPTPDRAGTAISMDTKVDAAPTPTAAVRRQRRIPLIWTVPLLTALIGGWLAWDTFSKRGPTIVVEFDYGNGLTPGQSQLKY